MFFINLVFPIIFLIYARDDIHKFKYMVHKEYKAICFNLFENMFNLQTQYLYEWIHPINCLLNAKIKPSAFYYYFDKVVQLTFTIQTPPSVLWALAVLVELWRPQVIYDALRQVLVVQVVTICKILLIIFHPFYRSFKKLSMLYMQNILRNICIQILFGNLYTEAYAMFQRYLKNLQLYSTQHI